MGQNLRICGHRSLFLNSKLLLTAVGASHNFLLLPGLVVQRVARPSYTMRLGRPCRWVLSRSDTI